MDNKTWCQTQKRLVKQHLTEHKVSVPEHSYPLSPVQAAKWIDDGIVDVLKKQRQQFVDQIIHLSFQDFLSYVCECTCGLKAVLGDQEWLLNLITDDTYYPHKSSEWVAQLMLQKCDMPPPIGLYLGQPEHETNLGTLCNTYFQDTKQLLPIVIVDDISYSGSQLSFTLTSLVSTLYRNGAVGAHIILVVPVIANEHNFISHLLTNTNTLQVSALKHPACQSVRIFELMMRNGVVGEHDFFDKAARTQFSAESSTVTASLDIPLTIINCRQFDSFEKTHPFPYRFSTNDQYQGIDISKRSRVYADHKLPDLMSVPTNLIGPLIEGCADYYQNTKTMDVMSPPCPPSPYKPKRPKPV